MKVAVIGTSKKENEKRVAIHPKHIAQIPECIRKELSFEKGYGIPFGISDETIARLTGNRLQGRSALLQNFRAVIIPKPVEEDFSELQKGTLVWGWIHSVQNPMITELAIHKKLTLIAWENMYYRTSRGVTHVFQKNNEMAGYCGVQHALQLRGIDGNFGAPRRVAVLSMGSVSRGAVYALKGHGFHDITVYTRRPSFLVSDKIPGIRYMQMKQEQDGRFSVVNAGRAPLPLADELAGADIIVNGILQDANHPAVFLGEDDVCKFTKECLIIDISCDNGMGFAFAKPTTISHPMFQVGNITYYAVDHTPTLMWDSASWEISACILQYLPAVVEQRQDAVLENAVDIREGMILNKGILAYQNRAQTYPYAIQKKDGQQPDAKRLLQRRISMRVPAQY